MQPKNTKKNKIKLKAQTGFQNCFLLTEPIEEVAGWEYKTVRIIIPLKLQTITIASKICCQMEEPGGGVLERMGHFVDVIICSKIRANVSRASILLGIKIQLMPHASWLPLHYFSGRDMHSTSV